MNLSPTERVVELSQLDRVKISPDASQIILDFARIIHIVPFFCKGEWAKFFSEQIRSLGLEFNPQDISTAMIPATETLFRASGLECNYVNIDHPFSRLLSAFSDVGVVFTSLHHMDALFGGLGVILNEPVRADNGNFNRQLVFDGSEYKIRYAVGPFPDIIQRLPRASVNA